MKDRVPHGRFDVCAKIFVQAMARPAVAPANFDRFSDFEVKRQLLFAFVGHVGDDSGGVVDPSLGSSF